MQIPCPVSVVEATEGSPEQGEQLPSKRTPIEKTDTAQPPVHTCVISSL